MKICTKRFSSIYAFSKKIDLVLSTESLSEKNPQQFGRQQSHRALMERFSCSRRFNLKRKKNARMLGANVKLLGQESKWLGINISASCVGRFCSSEALSTFDQDTSFLLLVILFSVPQHLGCWSRQARHRSILFVSSWNFTIAQIHVAQLLGSRQLDCKPYLKSAFHLQTVWHFVCPSRWLPVLVHSPQAFHTEAAKELNDGDDSCRASIGI